MHESCDSDVDEKREIESCDSHNHEVPDNAFASVSCNETFDECQEFSDNKDSENSNKDQQFVQSIIGKCLAEEVLATKNVETKFIDLLKTSEHLIAFTGVSFQLLNSLTL